MTEAVENTAVESNPAPTGEQTQQAAQDLQAFEKGFNAARGQPAEAKPEPKEEPEAVKAEEPAPEEAPDPWKDVPAVVRAEIDSIRGMVVKMPDRLRNIEGHIGGITSQLKTALASAKAVTSAQGVETPTQAQLEQAVLSPEKLKAIKEEFPEFGEAFEQLQGALSATRAELAKRPTIDAGSIKTEVEGAIEARIAAAEAKAAAAEEHAYVRLKYPAWKQTVQTEAFSSWFQTQAPDVQALAGSDRGEDAIALLDRFEEHRKKTEAAAAKAKANQDRLNRATAPQGVPTTPTTTISDEEALLRGWNKVRGG